MNISRHSSILLKDKIFVKSQLSNSVASTKVARYCGRAIDYTTASSSVKLREMRKRLKYKGISHKVFFCPRQCS